MKNISEPVDMKGWYQEPIDVKTKTKTNKINKVEKVSVKYDHVLSDLILKCDELNNELANRYDGLKLKEIYNAITHIDMAKKCLIRNN